VVLESFATGKNQLPGQLLEKIGHISESVPLLRSRFRQVRVLWGGTKCTLVPTELYDEKQASSYIHFTQSLQPGSAVFSDQLKNLQAGNVYAIPSVIKEYLNQVYPGHHLKHYLTILVESLLVINMREPSDTKIFVNVSAQTFDLIILRKGKLLFCNTFEFRSAEDFLYFVLFTFGQLQIDPAGAAVTLIGDILRPSAIYDLLLKYIREVSFISRSKAWEYSYVFSDLPGHFYYTLLNILTCE
jgi:hypothetical protein